MANVQISEISLTRSDPTASARVQISEIALTVTPPAAPAPTVQISGLWITRGYEPPVTEGGAWFRTSPGVWGAHNIHVRVSPGVWG